MVVRNAMTQDFLESTHRDLFHYAGDVWLGMSDQQVENTHTWVDGEHNSTCTVKPVNKHHPLGPKTCMHSFSSMPEDILFLVCSESHKIQLYN